MHQPPKNSANMTHMRLVTSIATRNTCALQFLPLQTKAETCAVYKMAIFSAKQPL